MPQIVAPSSVKGIDPLLVIARRSVTPLARCVGLGQSRISGKLRNRTINNTHLLGSARELYISLQILCRLKCPVVVKGKKYFRDR